MASIGGNVFWVRGPAVRRGFYCRIGLAELPSRRRVTTVFSTARASAESALQVPAWAAILPAGFWIIVEPLQSPSSCLSWAQRVVLVSAGVAILALLVLAAILTPDRRGFGTHERLGLPPCTFFRLTGYRCPSCGMTTAWSHLVRGGVADAFRDNVGGALLGLAAMVLGPWALISGGRGRWLWRPLGERAVLIAVSLLTAVTLLDWGVRFFLAR